VLRGVVDRFDTAVDATVAPLRGRPLLDALAAVSSALGDRGLVWFLMALARRGRPGPRRARALRAVAFTGALTPAVNQALKRAVRRARPPRPAVPPLAVRIPRSASFPSGHALAAWCAATLLAEGDGAAPLYYAMAAAVSYSRVHVRLHHASDVVAGSALGAGLGLVGRRLVPADGGLMRRLETAGMRRPPDGLTTS